MAGIPGQQPTKRTSVPVRYQKDGVSHLDGRYGAVKAVKARWSELAADLGGLSELSYQKRSLLWRFVFLESWIEDQERRMILGQAVDEGKWLTSLSSFTGLLARIGLERKARLISPIALLRQQQSTGTDLPISDAEIARPGGNAAGEHAGSLVEGERGSHAATG